MLHMFGFDWPSSFREDLTKDHGYTISSPCQPYGSGELKINMVQNHLWRFIKNVSLDSVLCQSDHFNCLRLRFELPLPQGMYKRTNGPENAHLRSAA